MPTFDEIAETFQAAGPNLQLELMREYAHQLPNLPEEYAQMRDAGLGTVEECQSAVFLHVEVTNGRVRVYADAPREAVIARAFLGILREAFHDAHPSAVHGAPSDPLVPLGLEDRVGLQRQKGLRALYQRVRQAVEAA